MTAACRAGCGVPLDTSLLEPDGMGLHPSCKARPAPMLPELVDILAGYQAGTARSMQTRIGPSEIGVECDRELAYRLFGIPRAADEGLKWAPLVGTWGHAGLAEAMAARNGTLRRERYLIERRVPVAPELGIDGVTDLYDTDTDEVIDWKFVGKTSMARYRRHGPGAVYRTQAHLYGRGWAHAGYVPRSVRVVFLPRWSHRLDDGWEWTEPYDAGLADAALARLARVRTLGLGLGLDSGGGTAWAVLVGNVGAACDYCPYRRPGGPADETGCPGNVAALRERAQAAFTKGLIA